MRDTPCRKIEPPTDLDPLLAEFVAELARAAVRRQKWSKQAEAEASVRKSSLRALLPALE